MEETTPAPPYAGILDESQLEAALAPDKRLIVAAGPGTGKTRTFAARIAHLVLDQGVPCRNVLALTFTRSAAGEMRERLSSMLAGSPQSGRAAEAWVETFHAAALRILREQRHPLGPNRALAVAGDEEKAAALEGLVPRRERRAFLDEVRLSKERLEPLATGPALHYRERLEAAGLADFEDILLHLVGLLESRPEVCDHYGALFQHVLVDEFQDTSFAQYRVLRLLNPENLCVIGDPDQSIYGFAGRAFSPFERFLEDQPSCRVVRLAKNYRSQASIVAAAGQVIAENRARVRTGLVAMFEKGPPVEITRLRTDRQEYEMIGRRIEALLGGSSHFALDSKWARPDEEAGRYGLSDFAVLCRTNAQVRRVARTLGEAGLPCRAFGKAAAGAAQEEDEVTKAEEREDFVSAAEGAPPVLKPRGEWISVMTMHRAKGLEFPVVFVAGCEDGLLPYRRELWLGGAGGTRQECDLEEERRLFYVAMTRAKSRLFLSCAASRSLYGRTLERPPSPFLADISQALALVEKSRARKKPKAVQPKLFES